MGNTTTETQTTSITPTNSSLIDHGNSGNQWLLVFKIVCLCTISIVGGIGNVTISTVLIRRRCKSSEFFILNLAIADLMVCAIGIPLDIYEQLHPDEWLYGGFLCKVIYPSQTLLILISIMTLTAMSLERYRAIMTPFKRLISKTAIMVSIGFIWALSIGVVAPYAKILTYNNDTCKELWPGERDGNYYTVVLFIIDYCIPLTIITCCYSRAGSELFKNAKKFNMDSKLRRTSENQNLSLRKRFQRNKRAIKVFSLAVLMFIVCMLPGDIYWMWKSFGNGTKFEYENHLQTFTNILVYFNSAINPFIFGACQMACFRTSRTRRRTNMYWRTCFNRTIANCWGLIERKSGSSKGLIGESSV